MRGKKVTSRDVALEAGVSQTAVSMILNGRKDVSFKKETVDLVWKTAKKLNYQPNLQARNMKLNRANSIGFLSSWRPTTFVYAPVMEGLQTICSDKNYSITLCTGKKNNQGLPDFIEYYLQNRIDALVYISYIHEDISETIGLLEKYHVPFVCVIGGMDLKGVNAVTVNLFQGAYMSTEHLINNGYKNIMYIEPYGELNSGEKQRVEGYKQALKDHHLSYQKIYKISHKNHTLEDIMEALKDNNSDGIVASHTELGYLTIKGAGILHINIPQELGVISCDHDTYAPYTAVPLTTADVPLYKMGEQAGNIIIDRLENKTDECIKIEIPSELSVRTSTKRT